MKRLAKTIATSMEDATSIRGTLNSIERGSSVLSFPLVIMLTGIARIVVQVRGARKILVLQQFTKKLTSPERLTVFREFVEKEIYISDTLEVTFSKSKTSSDWAGEGWYRVTGDAGTQLTKSSKSISCGGRKSTTLRDSKDPERRMGQKERILCMGNKYQDRYNYWTCRSRITIKVQNCGAYMVYELPDLGYYEGHVYCTE